MEKFNFYGTRGASSLTLSKYMEFGGATSCIVFNLNSACIMVDCGSGINNALEDLKNIEELHLFISHSHMDHISGIVNLLPAFEGKKLHIYGKTFNEISVQESISRMMSQSLWPVLAKVYTGVEFYEIGDEDIHINDITVSNMDSNHPGGCSLFRIKDSENDIVTAFDFCHLEGYDEKLIKFAMGCKTLIYDGNLTPVELEEKPYWGHSTPEMGAEIGKKLGVEELYITHFGIFDDDSLSAWESDLQKEYPFLSFARTGSKKDDFQKMVDIGTMLSIEKDNDVLLSKIVEASMDISKCDGGTLYILENHKLEFKVLINKSMHTKMVRKDMPIGMPAVNLSDKNICAAAARENKIINVADCYKEKTYDFSGVQKFDQLNNYHTQSVLVIPLVDDDNDVIGVLQLINAKTNTGAISTFKKKDESVIAAIANQAAMAIVNTSYSQRINDLLYGFVKVMSVGIDERTPYNANHTKNMIKFADRFLDYEDKANGPYKVDAKERREILMGIWLHDIGKILTPLDIMNKDSRLGDLYENIVNRFDRRDLLLRLALSNKQISKEEYQRLQEERQNQFDFINNINKIGFLNDDLRSQLDELATKNYRELDGSEKPVISHEEHHKLSIVKGTLSGEERKIMEDHVVMTQKFLSQLDFPKGYNNIPTYAGNHHEFLDGSGYPNHLTSDDLVWPCRLITVCDIFEALVAKDRPYKKPMPLEKAISILYEMAEGGKLDIDIVREYEKSKAWENDNESSAV